MEKHPIDQIFRDKLGDFEMNPPVGLMDRIHQEIAFRGRVRRMNQVRTFVSIAAALVLILMAGWFTLTPDQYADTSVPNLNQLKVMPDQTSKLQEAPETNIEQLANQKTQIPASAVKSIAYTKPVHSTKRATSNPISTEDKAIQANQTSGNEIVKVETADNNSSASKVEKATDNSSKSSKRGAEVPYYANANSVPVNYEKASAKGSWGIKAELSPMFSPTNPSSEVGVAVSKSVNTVSGGMIAAYKVNERLSIGTGIRFSQMKQGTHTAYALNAKSGISYLEPVEKSGTIAGDVSLNLPSKSSIVYYNGLQANNNNVASSDISQDFRYLEIPVQATYKLYDKKLSVGVTGGISTNILVGNNATMAENGIQLTNGRTQNLRDVLYSGSAGLELGYGLAKNLMLTVEPRIKQYMHSVSSNDQINYKPMQMGIFTGITYSFN